MATKTAFFSCVCVLNKYAEHPLNLMVVVVLHSQGFREDTGSFTFFHYQVLAARLAFFIVFEHVVFMVKFLVIYIIPNVPHSIHIQVRV